MAIRRSFLLLLFLLLSHLQLKAQDSPFKAGDLVFQDLDCGPLCDAIEKVTEGFQGYDFSHMGIVYQDRKSKKLYVIEAIGSKVRKTDLETFLQRSLDDRNRPKVIAGRLIPEYRHLIKKALVYAEDAVNTPYDDRFIMNNDSLYCSELIYEIFKKANKGEEVFSLFPMTFIDPATRTTFPAWIEYYHNLNSDIPEGQPGLNPGVISRSEKIEIFYLWGETK